MRQRRQEVVLQLAQVLGGGAGRTFAFEQMPPFFSGLARIVEQPGAFDCGAGLAGDPDN